MRRPLLNTQSANNVWLQAAVREAVEVGSLRVGGISLGQEARRALSATSTPNLSCMCVFPFFWGTTVILD